MHVEWPLSGPWKSALVLTLLGAASASADPLAELYDFTVGDTTSIRQQLPDGTAYRMRFDFERQQPPEPDGPEFYTLLSLIDGADQRRIPFQVTLRYVDRWELYLESREYGQTSRRIIVLPTGPAENIRMEISCQMGIGCKATVQQGALSTTVLVDALRPPKDASETRRSRSWRRPLRSPVVEYGLGVSPAPSLPFVDLWPGDTYAEAIVEADIVHADGFESGDLSGWSGVVGGT